MTEKRQKIGCLGVIAGFVVLAVLIWLVRPQPERRPPSTGPRVAVETMTVAHSDYQVMLQSYGTIQPQTRSVLVAQVAGQIVSVNPNVRDGGFFENGDVLATIDRRDYEADVRIAEATLMDARQALAEAEARSVQAAEDWQRLGNEGEAPDLVLRVPQLEAARAQLESDPNVKALKDMFGAELNTDSIELINPSQND